ncbi:MAG: zf-HC2 domain-containing protein [Deltaproteobacteria bacterium]|nr:zf-HC2 domain-containing protein [Deltaproteobacteria bacterium]
MTRDCRTVGRLISAYVDGELSPDRKARVEAEIAQCPGCRGEYERLLRMRALVWEVFQQDLRAAPARSVWDGMEARLQAVEAERRRGPAAWFQAWLERVRLGLLAPLTPAGAAAALGIVAVGVVLMVVSGPRRDPVPAAPGHLGEVTPLGAPAVAAGEESPRAPADPVQGPDLRRRTAHEERSFRRNELYVDSTEINQGIVIVDVDHEADTPAIVWHLDEEPEAGEDGAI